MYFTKPPDPLISRLNLISRSFKEMNEYLVELIERTAEYDVTTVIMRLLKVLDLWDSMICNICSGNQGWWARVLVS